LNTLLLCAIQSLCFSWSNLITLQDNDFLDLTKVTRTVTAKTTGRGGGISSTVGHTRRQPGADPFKITLLSINKRNYQLGDEVIYDILLENVAKNAVTIPWSPDQDAVRPDENILPPGSLESFISLVVTDDASGHQAVASHPIYGSELVSGSLKILRPGHSVRIRVPGQFVILDTEAAKGMLAKSPLKIEVRARFAIFNTQYEPAISINSQAIELRKR
jgi:hypothetical protein